MGFDAQAAPISNIDCCRVVMWGMGVGVGGCECGYGWSCSREREVIPTCTV